VKNNTELKWFGAIFAAAAALVWINIGSGLSLYDGFRLSFFHVSSAISSTCFSTVDFNLWPDFSRFIIFILMIMGACGGSTSGGLKIIRVSILFKAVNREIKRIIHPRSTPAVRVNGKAVEDAVISSVLLFFALYILIILGATLLLSFDNLGFVTTFTAAVSAVANTGLGFDMVGPAGNYSMFSSFSKIVLSFCMLAGRLEIFPILIIFNPAVWGKQ
jgi:trk system potassium uptake protein TrkH